MDAFMTVKLERSTKAEADEPEVASEAEKAIEAAREMIRRAKYLGETKAHRRFGL